MLDRVGARFSRREDDRMRLLIGSARVLEPPTKRAADIGKRLGVCRNPQVQRLAVHGKHPEGEKRNVVG